MAGADAQAPRHDPWKLVAGLVGAFEERSCACVRGWVAGRTLREPSTCVWVQGAVRARRPKRQRGSTTSFPWRRGLPWCFGFGSGGCVCLLCVCFVRKLSSVLYLSYAHQRHTHKPGSYHELTCRTAPESATARHAAVQLRRPLTVWLASSGRRQQPQQLAVQRTACSCSAPLDSTATDGTDYAPWFTATLGRKDSRTTDIE